MGERRLRVEPGAYPGRWAFEETWHRGAATVALRPGPNAFRIGAVGDFDVHLGPPSAGRPPVLTAPDGTARVVERDAPRALPRLFLETKPLLVVVREYRGDWHLAGVNEPSDRLAGRRSMVPLVRGLDYQFVVAAEGRFRFRFDRDGRVHTDKSDSAETAGNELIFRNTTATFSAGASVGDWHLPYVTRPRPGLEGVERRVVLVPGLSYTLAVGVEDRIAFHVDPDGRLRCDRVNVAEADGNRMRLCNPKADAATRSRR